MELKRYNNETFNIDQETFFEILELFKNTFLEDKDIEIFEQLQSEKNYQKIYEYILKEYRIDIQNEYCWYIEGKTFDFDNFELESEPYYLKRLKYKIIYKSGQKIRFRNELCNAKAVGDEIASSVKNNEPGDIIIQDQNDYVVAIKKFIHREYTESEYNLLRFEVYVDNNIIVGENGYYTEWIMVR